jgi:hypothetical protein
MNSLKKFIARLKCPFSNEIDLNQRDHIIKLVNWLEDRKIRELEIEQRVVLRKDNNEWDKHFDNYLRSLDCPYEWPLNSIDCIYWILHYAISLDYEAEFKNKIETFVEPDVNITKSKIDSVGQILNIQRKNEECDSGG